MTKTVNLETPTKTTFSNATWRELLQETYLDLNIPNLKGVISPFGFEVLENKKYLGGHLRKFYVYIGIEETAIYDEDALALKYKQILIPKLQKQMPQFFEDIVVTIENQTVTKLNMPNYTCKPQDKLLDIQIRRIPKQCDSILDDYADYLIATIDAVLNQKGEAQKVMSNSVMRSRMFQLYVILEKLYGPYAPKLNTNQIALYKEATHFISNELAPFFHISAVKKTATETEKKIYHELVLK